MQVSLKPFSIQMPLHMRWFHLYLWQISHDSQTSLTAQYLYSFFCL